MGQAGQAAARGVTSLRRTQNTSGYDNGGQSGFYWASDGDGNLYVAQSAMLSSYFGGSFQLETPPSGVSYTDLFAPTTHAGASDCIEGVTSYSNGYGWVGYTRGQFQVYDFCLGGYEASYDMDSTFMDNYVRVWSNSGNEIPKYIMEETTLKSGDGYFHALIYNANTGNWDDFYDANSGLSNSRTDGWSIFETHYGASSDTASEACSNATTLSETGLRLHNTSGYYEVTSSDVGSGFTYGNCIGSPYASYYYTFSYDLSNDAQWVVTTN